MIKYAQDKHDFDELRRIAMASYEPESDVWYIGLMFQRSVGLIDGEFISTFSPGVVIDLIDEIARLRESLREAQDAGWSKSRGWS